MLPRAAAALLVAALLVPGCLRTAAPTDAAPDAPDGNAAPEPAEPAAVVDGRATPERLLPLAQATAAEHLPGARLLWLTSGWEGASEGAGFEAFRESVTRTARLDVDGRSHAWEFTYVDAEGRMLVLVLGAAGEEIQLRAMDMGFLYGEGAPMGPGLPRFEAAPEWMRTSRLADALRADERTRAALDEPLRQVSYRLTGAQGEAEPRWHVMISTRGAEHLAIVDADSWEVRSALTTPETLPVEVVRIEGIRERADAGITTLAFTLRLAPDATQPLDLEWLLLWSFVPGWNAAVVRGEAPGYLRFEGAGDDALDPGETLVVTWEPPFGPLGPGEHVGLAFRDDGWRDASFTTPEVFGDARQVTLR